MTILKNYNIWLLVINGYWYLFYWWLLMPIIGYFINSYWWLFYLWPLVVFIVGY
jgi:hypothetical protein